MKRIGIKYCGGCNPHIDRTKLVREIIKLLPPEYIFTTEDSSSWDIVILLCGCPSACADKPEIKNPSSQWIVVAGCSVDLDRAPEEKLADVIVGRIKKLHSSIPAS